MADGDARTEGVPRGPGGGVEESLPNCLDGNGGDGGAGEVEDGI